MINKALLKEHQFYSIKILNNYRIKMIYQNIHFQIKLDYLEKIYKNL